MKIKSVLTALCCFIVLGSGLFAQDVIRLNTGKKINAKILEINDYEIKYHEYNDPNKLVFTISRALIKEIKFEYGKVIEQTEPGNDEGYYLNDHNSNVKINFTAIANAVTILTYERSLNMFSSFEGSVKINGLGINNNAKKDGFGLNVAYKIKAKSVFKNRGQYRPDHLLHGGYFRLNLGYNNVSSQLRFSNSNYNYNYVNFGLDWGKQWVLQNAIVIDLFIGYHYFGGSIKNVTSGDVRKDFEFTDGDLFGSDNTALSIGLRFGVLFGKNQNNSGKRR